MAKPTPDTEFSDTTEELLKELMRISGKKRREFLTRLIHKEAEFVGIKKKKPPRLERDGWGKMRLVSR